MTADGYATDQDRASVEQAAELDRLRAEVAALRAENDRLLSQLPIEAARADLDGMGVDCEPAIARVLAAVRSARERAGHPPAPTPADLLDAETQE